MVQYTVSGDVTEADYESLSGTVTIEPDNANRAQTLTLSTVNDSFEEGDETLTVTLSLGDQTEDVEIGTPSASATITDNDTLTVTVSNNDMPNVLEGHDATFALIVESTVTSTAHVVVDYTVGGDVTSADYDGPKSRTHTIDAGSSTAIITIATVDDNLPEADEGLTVKLTKATTRGRRVTLGAPSEVTTTIGAEDGTVPVGVQGGAVNEGGDAKFTVTLGSAALETVHLQYYTTEPAEPTTSADFTAVPSTSAESIMIEKGKTSITFSVPTTQDDLAEADETFTVVLQADSSNPLPDYVSIRVDRATGTIRDDDALRASVTADQNTLTAAAVTQEATFTVKLTRRNGEPGSGSQPVLVEYAGGSATLTIAAEDSEDTITIDEPSGSAWQADPPQSVGVQLTRVTSSAGTVSLGTTSASTTIVDEATVVVSIPGNASEIEGAPIEFTVSRDSDTNTYTGKIVVDYVVERGTATIPDFTAPSTRSLTLPDENTITVKTTNDTLVEANEQFTVRLTGAKKAVSSDPGNVVLGAARGTATIRDDDELDVSIESRQTTVLEGSSAVFTVKLTKDGTSESGAGSADVVVDYEVPAGSDAKAADKDFTAPSGKLTIRAGQSSGAITIAANDDDVLEPGGENLVLTLTGTPTTSPADKVDLGTPATAMTTIRDRVGTVIVSLEDARSVVEGQSAVFDVTLSGAVSVAVVATLTVPSDFETPDGLSIPMGETTGSFTVATTDNSQAEKDRTLSVTLDLDTELAGLVEGKNTATATIRDNDPLTVNVSAPRWIHEAESAVFTVTLTGGTGSDDVVVDYSVGGTATEDNAYTAPRSGALTIDGGGAPQSAETITITDALARFDPGDTLTVKLTGVTTSGRATVGTPRQVTTTVAAVTVSVTSVTHPSTEGESAQFTVSLSSDVSENALVRYGTVNGSATSPADYTAQSGTVTFEASSSRSTVVTVNTQPDTLAEGNETFSLAISEQRLPPGVEIGTAQATATIPDNDMLTATVTRQQPEVPEGSAATFEVELNFAGGSNVVVEYGVSDRATATGGKDYAPPSGTLTIRAGQTTGTISIATIEDDVLDRGETLLVELTAWSVAGTKTTPQTAPESESTLIRDENGTVVVSVADTTTDEGEEAVFTVTLSGMVDSNVQVPFQIGDGPAPNGDGDVKLCVASSGSGRLL